MLILITRIICESKAELPLKIIGETASEVGINETSLFSLTFRFVISILFGIENNCPHTFN